ncbi:hypothetical protein [Hungatella hathewayi]|uniref:hypothetical protein n=1 Tax=Hungatella hathewayi TaxID=154046 RepID=UPI0035687A46
MPRGVRRPKSERLREELDEVIKNLQNLEESKADLEEKKTVLEQELRFCENELVLNMVDESGLSPEEIKEAIERYRNTNAEQAEVAATNE